MIVWTDIMDDGDCDRLGLDAERLLDAMTLREHEQDGLEREDFAEMVLLKPPPAAGPPPTSDENGGT